MPTPPVAERRQHAATHHGITRQDPYHWLRADNWQEVMQAPETLPADIRAYLEAENAYFAEAFETPHAALTDDDLPRDPRPHQRGRERHPDARWPLGLQFAHGRGQAVPDPRPHAARRRRRDRSCSTATSKPATSYFGFGGGEHDPTTGCSPGPPTARARSSTPSTSATSRPARTPARVIEDIAGGGVWSADSKRALLHRVRRQPPPVPRPPPRARHAAGRRRDRLRGDRSRLLRRRRRDAEPAASSSSTRTTTRPRSSG